MSTWVFSPRDGELRSSPTACDRAFRLIGAARIVRACRARHVQEVIFHSRDADVAKRVTVVEVDRRAARAGTLTRPPNQ